MNTFTKTLAIVSILSVMAASPTAFAAPYIVQKNEARYRVSAQETLTPYAPTAPQVVKQSTHQALDNAVDPHWGPAFAPDVE